MKQGAIGKIWEYEGVVIGIHNFRFYRFLKHWTLNFLSHFFLYDPKWQRAIHIIVESSFLL